MKTLMAIITIIVAFLLGYHGFELIAIGFLAVITGELIDINRKLGR